MRKVSRRDFLKRSSGIAVGTAALSTGGNMFSAEPHIQFPSKPHARLGVASYPFREYMESARASRRELKQPIIDLKDFGAMVVRRFRVNNIEPWSAHFKSTDPRYLETLRAAFEKADAHVINIPSDIRHSVYDPNSAMRAEAVNEAKAWVDVAVMVGSPSIRVHIGGGHDMKPDVDRAAQSLRQIADYGAGKNVVINLENDDLVTEDAFFVVKVIERTNSPYLHALPDFGNSMMSGDADFNYRAVAAMFKHAYNISHVKNGESGDDGKFVPVDVGKTFGIAKAAGYRGYFSMELEGPGDPFAGTQELLDLSMKYLT